MPGLAQLPMYDWPEVRAGTDALWAAIAANLAALGIDAPDRLDRTIPAGDAWTSPDLLVGQTCGRPYVNGLAGRVALLGRPTYAADGAGPGRYCSLLVARSTDRRSGPGDFRGAVAACNSETSQSGWAALIDSLPQGESLHGFFGAVHFTGGHRESIRAVADGTADIAAIDCVAWALALRHEPAAGELKEIGRSPDYPSLPFITGDRRSAEEVARIGEALRRAVAGLPAQIREALMLVGMENARPADYACLKESGRAA